MNLKGLKIGPKGKAHVLQMIQKYPAARKLAFNTRSGATERTVKRNCRINTVAVSAEQQVKEICPVYFNIGSVMGERSKFI